MKTVANELSRKNIGDVAAYVRALPRSLAILQRRRHADRICRRSSRNQANTAISRSAVLNAIERTRPDSRPERARLPTAFAGRVATSKRLCTATL
jgi:hypothetical protein